MPEKQITVGMELEMVKAIPETHIIARRYGFGVRSDASIQNDAGESIPATSFNAVELVTGIILASQDSLDGISLVVDKLTKCADHVNSSCGFHIHLGNPSEELSEWNPNRVNGIKGGPKSVWTPTQVYTWLTAGVYFEQIGLFDTVPRSRRVNENAVSISSVYSPKDISSNDPVGEVASRKYANKKRYCWLNLIETKRKKADNENRVGYASSEGLGTVEVRLLGETKDAGYIMEWTKLWFKVAFIIAHRPASKAIMEIVASKDISNSIKVLKYMAATHDANNSHMRSIVKFNHEYEN